MFLFIFFILFREAFFVNLNELQWKCIVSLWVVRNLNVNEEEKKNDGNSFAEMNNVH